MATDYKKILINYFDKIIFLLFLVLFIVMASRVVMSKPSDDTRVPTIPRKPFPVPVELHKERFVLNKLANPEEPDATLDFTSDPEKIAPGQGEKQCPQCGWIVKETAAKCPNCNFRWRAGADDENGDKPPPEDLPKGIPFRVTEITRKPVDILFKGFIENPFKLRFDLQMHWGMGTKMSIVPLGETFRGYRLYPLDKKEVEVNDPKMGRRTEDRYYLTIQKPGEEPLIVERGTIVREREAMGMLDAAQGRWDIYHRGEKVASDQSLFEVYAQFRLQELEGEKRVYDVVEVNDREKKVVFRGKDGEELVLEVAPRRAVATVGPTR